MDMIIKPGIVSHWLNNTLLVSVEGDIRQRGPFGIGVGIEWKPIPAAAVRFGQDYRSFSVGASMALNSKDLDISWSTATIPTVPDVYRFGIKWTL